MPMRSALFSWQAATNFSGATSMPRSTTFKPPPVSIIATRFLPMSCRSPLTVPMTTVAERLDAARPAAARGCPCRPSSRGRRSAPRARRPRCPERSPITDMPAIRPLFRMSPGWTFSSTACCTFCVTTSRLPSITAEAIPSRSAILYLLGESTVMSQARPKYIRARRYQRCRAPVKHARSPGLAESAGLRAGPRPEIGRNPRRATAWVFAGGMLSCHAGLPPTDQPSLGLGGRGRLSGRRLTARRQGRQFGRCIQRAPARARLRRIRQYQSGSALLRTAS